MDDRKVTLTTLWVFAVLNFLYADVVELFHLYGSKTTFQLTSPGALLGVSVLVEIPMAMVILSLILGYRVNRSANIVVGAVYTAVTIITQFVLPATQGTVASFYLFFGVIEILTTSFIVWYAWKWPSPNVDPRRATPLDVGGAC